ncbi:MAG: 4-hydroxy-tetrahydrodipicolinate synthase, partial [Candidatus Peregrinibacteria bacterium]|nr:4-hydroxy-tetrahydrodipicolinate synthase [Candidatus Peregrinibacteria bacterium]
GSNCTAEAIEYSVHAEKAGVDGLLQVSPYYNKPTQKGLFEHFTAIANAVNIPIILYNIAGRCGVNIETETVVKLAEHQNIIAVKEASGNLDQMRDVLARTPDDFLVFSGDDGLTLELAKMGGNGVISVISNILPSETKQFVDFCLNGEYEAAQKMQEKFEPLFRDLFIETNPEPIKTLMAEEGFCKEVFRLPITTMLPENKVTLLKTWNEYKNN